MTTILIARHGNNFEPGETAVRIGRRTDLALSSSGKQQAKYIGAYLKQFKIFPAAVFTSQLKRTQETAFDGKIEKTLKTKTKIHHWQ